MGVKYVKEQLDLNIEARDMQSNKALKYLQDINFYKFKVGDVLVREDAWSGTWKIKTAACGIPYKYVYVFENELGVGYIRRLSVDGTKFVDTPICVVEFDPASIRFQLEPNYANHILLNGVDEEYDLRADYKDVKGIRDRIYRCNEKMVEKTDTVADAIAFLRKIKSGDLFWMGYGIRSVRKDPYTVVKVTLQHYPAELSSLEYLRASYIGSLHARPNKMLVENIMRAKILLQKPFDPDEM